MHSSCNQVAQCWGYRRPCTRLDTGLMAQADKYAWTRCLCISSSTALCTNPGSLQNPGFITRSWSAQLGVHMPSLSAATTVWQAQPVYRHSLRCFAKRELQSAAWPNAARAGA